MTDILPRERPVRTSESSSSIMELVKELRDETVLLLRQEVLLARREVEEKIVQVRRATIVGAAGALMTGFGVLVLLLAASAGLSEALQEMGLASDIAVWLSPLIVGSIVCIAGSIMIWSAKTRLSATSLTPEKTIESLEDNKRWAKQKVQDL